MITKGKVDIDIDLLISYNLDVESYMVCYCKYHKLDFNKYKMLFGDIPRSKYSYMVSAGFLIQTSINPSYDTTDLIEKKFLSLTVKEAPERWIQEWFDLWPRGVMSGGYYVRTDINGCYKKMLRFMKNNTGYDKKLIIQATKNYLNRSMAEGYEYLKLAPNFIEKERVSTLAGECEAVLDKISHSEETINQGNLFAGNEIK